MMHKYLHQQLVNAPLDHLMVGFPFIFLEELLKLYLTKSVLKKHMYKAIGNHQEQTNYRIIGFDKLNSKGLDLTWSRGGCTDTE